jgi:catechol 2,3-dioxygenase-like lactoylglutathione lyase family enzyme
MSGFGPLASAGRTHSGTPDLGAGRGTLDWQTGVVLRIGSIIINVSDTSRAAEFWKAALGYTVHGGTVPKDESTVLRPAVAGSPAITLDGDDRMHLDLHVDSEEELAAEVVRLVHLGARRVDWSYPDRAAFVVLTDTEGNLFCVVNAGDKS